MPKKYRSMSARERKSHRFSSDTSNSPQQSPTKAKRKAETLITSTRNSPRKQKIDKDGNTNINADTDNLIYAAGKTVTKCESNGTTAYVQKEQQDHVFDQLSSDVGDYVVSGCMRCHGRHDDPTDGVTRIWQCAFEPGGSGVVATCGGHTLCLVHCESGAVVKRLDLTTAHSLAVPPATQPLAARVGRTVAKETLYTLAWTTVTLRSGARANVLATAGQCGNIYLVLPDQLINYDTLDKHLKAINALQFHPQQTTQLFSGGEDMDIVWWDIGVPNPPAYESSAQVLRTIKSGDSILNLAYSLQHNLLMLTTEVSCKGWTVTNDRRRDTSRLVEFDLSAAVTERRPIYKAHQDLPARDRMEVYDGLTLLTDDLVASKVSQRGVITVWSLAQCMSAAAGSGGAAVVTVTPVAHLLWSPTAHLYIYVSSVKDSGILTCGDSEGRIWLYNLAHLLPPGGSPKKRKVATQITHGQSTKISTYIPNKVYALPDCEVSGTIVKKEDVMVNKCVLSGDGEFLVACTDVNLLFIYRRQHTT